MCVSPLDPDSAPSLAYITQEMGSDSVELAEPLIGLAEVYKKLGKYADSQRVLTKALRIIETGFGPDHPKMAAALHSLAHIHRKQHDDREAERLYCRALAIEEKHGNEAEVAENLLYLAIIHAEQAGKSSEGVSSPRREERGSEREEKKRRKEKEKDRKQKEKAVKAKEKTVPRTEENEYDDEGVLMRCLECRLPLSSVPLVAFALQCWV